MELGASVQPIWRPEFFKSFNPVAHDENPRLELRWQLWQERRRLSSLSFPPPGLTSPPPALSSGAAGGRRDSSRARALSFRARRFAREAARKASAAPAFPMPGRPARKAFAFPAKADAIRTDG